LGRRGDIEALVDDLAEEEQLAKCDGGLPLVNGISGGAAAGGISASRASLGNHGRHRWRKRRSRADSLF
jgi:hypothetical protein